MISILSTAALLLFWLHCKRVREIELQNIALAHSGERQLARGVQMGYDRGARQFVDGWNAAIAACRRGE